MKNLNLKRVAVLATVFMSLDAVFAPMAWARTSSVMAPVLYQGSATRIHGWDQTTDRSSYRFRWTDAYHSTKVRMTLARYVAVLETNSYGVAVFTHRWVYTTSDWMRIQAGDDSYQTFTYNGASMYPQHYAYFYLEGYSLYSTMYQRHGYILV